MWIQNDFFSCLVSQYGAHRTCRADSYLTFISLVSNRVYPDYGLTHHGDCRVRVLQVESVPSEDKTTQTALFLRQAGSEFSVSLTVDEERLVIRMESAEVEVGICFLRCGSKVDRAGAESSEVQFIIPRFFHDG